MDYLLLLIIIINKFTVYICQTQADIETSTFGSNITVQSYGSFGTFCKENSDINFLITGAELDGNYTLIGLDFANTDIFLAGTCEIFIYNGSNIHGTLLAIYKTSTVSFPFLPKVNQITFRLTCKLCPYQERLLVYYGFDQSFNTTLSPPELYAKSFWSPYYPQAYPQGLNILYIIPHSLPVLFYASYFDLKPGANDYFMFYDNATVANNPYGTPTKIYQGNSFYSHLATYAHTFIRFGSDLSNSPNDSYGYNISYYTIPTSCTLLLNANYFNAGYGSITSSNYTNKLRTDNYYSISAEENCTISLSFQKVNIIHPNVLSIYDGCTTKNIKIKDVNDRSPNLSDVTSSGSYLLLDLQFGQSMAGQYFIVTVEQICSTASSTTLSLSTKRSSADSTTSTETIIIATTVSLVIGFIVLIIAIYLLRKYCFASPNSQVAEKIYYDVD